MPISTDINNFVFKLSSGGHVVGPSRLVSVKRSDALSVEVESYYTEDPAPSTGQSLAQIFTGLLLGLGSQAPGIIPSGEQGMDVFANPASAQSAQLFQFLSDTQTMEDLQKPKSYLVYLFFDKNLMLDGQYSGIIQVGRAGQLNLLQQHLSAMQREGYFYTYVTNQSERRVYYNNLTLVHKRGNIVQSNDYYPFGLTWENPKDHLHTYQGKELQCNEWSSGGLDMLDFHARMYNPLIGRWHNPDPMNQFDSPYNAMGNNPVINIDPDGMWSLPWGGIAGSAGSLISKMTTTWVVSPRDMSKTAEYSWGHGFGEALQIAGAAFSFLQGSTMLRDGQLESGLEASSVLSGIWIVSVDNSYFPTEWWGHTALTFGRNDAVWNQKGNETWYFSAGGESYPRRKFEFDESFRGDNGEWVEYYSTYETPDCHGIIQEYMLQNRYVFMSEIPLPVGCDQTKAMNFLIENIQKDSRTCVADCDCSSGKCTSRVKQQLIMAITVGGISEANATLYIERFLSGSFPIDDEEMDVEPARKTGFSRYMKFIPDGQTYWFERGTIKK